MSGNLSIHRSPSGASALGPLIPQQVDLINHNSGVGKRCFRYADGTCSRPFESRKGGDITLAEAIKNNKVTPEDSKVLHEKLEKSPQQYRV